MPQKDINTVKFVLEFGGLNTVTPAANLYPDASGAANVRWGLAGELKKRDGFTTYNSTAMSGGSVGTANVVTGLFGLNRRDTTTRYTVVATKDEVFTCPTSGNWTRLATGIGASITDMWDATTYNDELILVNGVSTPIVTGGTLALTANLVTKAWQTRTTLPSAQGGAYGLQPLEGAMVLGCGAGASTSYEAVTQSYDPAGDAWRTLTRANVKRDDGGGGTAFDRALVCSGSITATTGTATCEMYFPEDEIWRGVTNITTARRQFQGLSMDNAVFCIGGNSNFNGTTLSAVNEKYDPAADAWSTKTAMTVAKRQAAGGTVSNLGYAVSGTTGALVTTNYQYNPFSDAWTTMTAITNARTAAGGVSNTEDNTLYVVGGQTSVPADSAVVQSYNPITDTWTQETAVTTARSLPGGGADGHWAYATGGTTSAAATVTDHQRLNVSPAAPVAMYVEALRNQVLMARTASFPSRVYFSPVGDSHTWPSDNFFDVNRDDGDWITGLFVYEGRLYVSKTDHFYECQWTRLDADPAVSDLTITELAQVPGTVSNRSIVVTDHGAYYLAEDGFRVFDGAQSVRVSDKIQTTFNSLNPSFLKRAVGIWNKANHEVWINSAGQDNTLFVYNYRFQKWARWSGIDGYCMALVEDANDLDQILFGTQTASDGKIYFIPTALNNSVAIPTSDNGGGISALYTGGFFSQAGGITDFSSRIAYLFTKRVSNTLTLSVARDFSAATVRTEPIVLSTQNDYFPTTTDQRAKITLGDESVAHALSFVWSDSSSTAGWEIYQMVILGHADIKTGYGGTGGG